MRCPAPTAAAQTQEVPDSVEVTGGVAKLAGSGKVRTMGGSAVTVAGRRFAIAGGEIDPVDANPADINHRGKLTFRAAGREGSSSSG